jgi:sarcosine oxidase
METFDAIVVGLGAHGSATAAELARRGQRVLGLERFERGEGRGSSGGWSRFIRLAHYERPWLAPLAVASWDRWRALEAETGASILTQTGGLYGGPAGSSVVEGALASVGDHDLAFELLDAAEIHARWPVFELAEDTLGVLEAKAGALRADRANAAHLAAAERLGAVLRFGCRVVDWRPAPGGGFEVEDAAGVVVGADHLVLTAGPWVGDFVPDLALPLRVERERPMWWDPPVDPAASGADRLPVWVVEEAGTEWYGIPHDPELGLKVSIHHWAEFVDPETVDRTVDPADVERVRNFLRRRMPAANGPLRHAEVCLYTNTPDEIFVIDRHPAASGVAFASACSGTGFKFAPVIGAVLADLVTDGSTAWPIERFRVDRFGSASSG